ncbi:MAG TPA: VWA domain-containing protein [Terriglobia bacterium]|jgi:VWFA-related protein|nr:VWA domain-containing protein [Terriglobia bacterium]
MNVLHRGSFSLLLGVTAILLGLVADVAAQSHSFWELPNHTLQVNVNLVTFNFRATGKHWQNVGDLKKEDVIVYEDEVRQEIISFETEPVPVSLAVLVDVSDSTRPFSKQIETTSHMLLDLLGEQDEAAVIAFSNFPDLLQEFTHDKGAVRSALQRANSFFSGATNISDSVYLAAKKLSATPSWKRKVILLISDGKGNRGDRERALGQLKASKAALWGIGVGLTAKPYRASLLIAQWAKETGGSCLSYSPEMELRRKLQDALDIMRCQYAAAYVPSNRRRDGSFRRLRVEISQESPVASKKVSLQGPDGYYAPGESLLHR